MLAKSELLQTYHSRIAIGRICVHGRVPDIYNNWTLFLRKHVIK
jgi:hypothetical protein